MPRGVYERKQPMHEKRVEPARVCAGCASFVASDDRDARNRILGLCHFWPRPQLVNAEHHCRQWQWEGKS